MNTLQRIRSIAQDVREWAETLDGERMSQLCGYCAIASAELHKRLKAAGIDTEICISVSTLCSHVFLIAEDHVIDVTATQFNEFSWQPVVVLHEREAQAHWFYEVDYRFDTPMDLRRYQVKNKWPQSQIARR